MAILLKTLGYTFLFAALSSYREILVLIERGSWKANVTWLPFWKTDWQSFWAVFDTHHFTYGLFILAIAFSMRKGYKITGKIYDVVIIWFTFFYFRNICMHVLFMNPEFIRWKYLLPITF